MPPSRRIADAAEHALRLRLGRAVIADWQAEHGHFTPEESAAARAGTNLVDAEKPSTAGPQASL